MSRPAYDVIIVGARCAGARQKELRYREGLLHALPAAAPIVAV